MKILTVCIICSEENNTLNKVIDSCLLLKDDIEIILIGDQNNPIMLNVAPYVVDYPEDIKICHSTAVDAFQTGVHQANGLYFKILDSGDIIDTSVLVKVVETFKDLLRIQANLDMMICDYEYPRKKKKSNVVTYTNVFPLDKVFKWHQTKKFKTTQRMRMETVIIKTNLLKKIDFVDSYNQGSQDVLLLQTLPSIKSMYYLNKSLQHMTTMKYNSQVMIPVQEYYNGILAMIDTIDIAIIESRKFRNYIVNHVNSALLHFSNVSLKQGALEARLRKEEILEHIVLENIPLYRALKKTTAFRLYSSDVKITRSVISRRYKNIK